MSWLGIKPGPHKWEGDHSRKDPLEHLVNRYSEHLHISTRPAKDACDNMLFSKSDFPDEVFFSKSKRPGLDFFPYYNTF
jgi:hypothetical protein